jgi:hypothetical protein
MVTAGGNLRPLHFCPGKPGKVLLSICFSAATISNINPAGEISKEAFDD